MLKEYNTSFKMELKFISIYEKGKSLCYQRCMRIVQEEYKHAEEE